MTVVRSEAIEAARPSEDDSIVRQEANRLETMAKSTATSYVGTMVLPRQLILTYYVTD